MGFQLDTLIIALVTLIRVSLKGVVESVVGQRGWLWVSEEAQRRKGREARLQDWKVWDEASRGVWGALWLLWRLGVRHVGCLGAAIVVLANGFESFSGQMVLFEQRPREMAWGEYSPRSPARAEVWDTYLTRGWRGDWMPVLSTKAAVYSGVLSAEVKLLNAECQTANCTWPVVPTLAACGECVAISVEESCNKTSRMCEYSTSLSSLNVSMDVEGYSSFTVTPSNGSIHPLAETKVAYFSIFEMLSASRVESEDVVVEANECALWFCIKGYHISVEGGTQSERLVGSWSDTMVIPANDEKSADYVFVDIPTEKLNVDNGTRYTITHEAMTALRYFMTSITTGTVNAGIKTLSSSSDWAEAMWNATDRLPDWISTLTESMTAEFREHGQISSSSDMSRRYNGYATQLSMFMKVQWLWTLYPLILIILSIYFLFHTIISSVRNGVSAWKTSALPMLFCRVDEKLRERAGDAMDEPDGIEERVGDLRVALSRADDGQWGFRMVSDDELRG